MEFLATKFRLLATKQEKWQQKQNSGNENGNWQQKQNFSNKSPDIGNQTGKVATKTKFRQRK
ncbi:hypothetical protein BCI9360_03633 [Bacillus sp. CECT 9360]|nr:hypothetical protein BCI9360_03633 [Bacillus sp. CECT 9360]